MLKNTLKTEWVANGINTEIKLMYVYRYLSWFLTSIFYIFNNETEYLFFNIGVIISILIASKFITGLYAKYSNNVTAVKSLVLTETLGISLLLIPTGGVHSLFLWYAMNPVLVSASFLSGLFCWLNLVFYLSFSTTISYFIFNKDNITLLQLISRNSYLILIFILMTLGFQLLSKLIHQLQIERDKLMKKNNEMIKASKKIEEAMEHIMALYQAVEMFSSQNNKEKLINTFTYYAKELTKSAGTFFYSTQLESNNIKPITICGDISWEIRNEIIEALEKIFRYKNVNTNIFNINIQEKKFIISIVKSTSRSFGMLGVELGAFVEENNLYNKQLSFLSELSAIILERLYLEEMTQRLVITEEQNRIANEMHDSVSQRLFSISCAIHTIVAKYNNLLDSELRDQLMNIKDSTNTTMKELRTTIYRLSSKKQGVKPFRSDIKDYINSISKLNNIDIKFKCTGDEDIITATLKKALYRIIAEITGNSIRHGKSNKIQIELDTNNSSTQLIINDNGQGFIVDNLSNEKDVGIGINNIKRLVESFDGNVTIESLLGKGTCTKVVIPNGKLVRIDEGGLVG